MFVVGCLKCSAFSGCFFVVLVTSVGLFSFEFFVLGLLWLFRFKDRHTPQPAEMGLLRHNKSHISCCSAKAHGKSGMPRSSAALVLRRSKEELSAVVFKGTSLKGMCFLMDLWGILMVFFVGSGSNDECGGLLS